MKTLILSFLVGAGALVLMCPQVRADEWNKKTEFTFSQPVEVPGRVLPAGSYVFKLADSQSDRHIVQVFNQRENHLYGTYLAIPAYRAKTPDKPIITFEERAAGSPPAVNKWFYPGDNYGDQFVYSKNKTNELASLSNETIPPAPETAANPAPQPQTMNEATVPPATEQPQANVAQPNNQEDELAQTYPPASVDNNSANRSAENPSTQNSDQNSAMDNASNENTNQQLPKTAGDLPLIGLIGLASLGAGFSLRAVAKRVG